MKHIISSFLLLLVVSQFVNAQKKEIIIKGTIIDSTTKIPLPYSEILIKNDKDSLLAGAITNEKGEFSVKTNFKKGNKLIARSFGYGAVKRELGITDSTSVFQMGNILLNIQSKELGMVTIESTRPFIEKKFDREVYNMSEGAVASARNIFDLLKKIPGITVDEENEKVNYKGNGTIIRINNTPAERMYPKLELIPIDNVDKIEVIDPSMRGKGSGGSNYIINIKMKKVRREGLSGAVNARANFTDFTEFYRGNANLNTNYKYKKFIFYNNFYVYSQKINWSEKSWGEKINTIGHYNDTSSWHVENNYKSIGDYFGIGYNFNATTLLNINLGGSFEDNPSNSQRYYKRIDLGSNVIIDETSSKSYKETPKMGRTGIGLNFSSDLDTNGKEFIIDLWSNIISMKDHTNGNIKYLTQSDENNITINKTDNIYLYYSIFYNHPVSKKTRWNIELSGSNMPKQNSSQEFTRNGNLIKTLWENDKTPTYENSLSFHLGTTIKKFKIDGGLSLSSDIMNLEFNRYLNNTNDTNFIVDKNFTYLSPSATIKYEINQSHEIKFSYDRSVDIPYYTEFLPYINKQNTRNWSSGNEMLNPSIFQSFYLGYTYNKEIWNTTIQGFYKHTNNARTYINYPIDSVTTLSKPENLASKKNIGIYYSFWVQAHKNLTISLNINYFYSIFDLRAIENLLIYYGMPTDNLLRKSWNYGITSNVEYRKKRSYVSLYLQYNSKQMNEQGYQLPDLRGTLSFSQRFFDNKFRFSININNLFYGIFPNQNTTEVFGYKSTNERINSYSKRSLGISIRYVFGYGERNTQNKREGR